MQILTIPPETRTPAAKGFKTLQSHQLDSAGHWFMAQEENLHGQIKVHFEINIQKTRPALHRYTSVPVQHYSIIDVVVNFLTTSVTVCLIFFVLTATNWAYFCTYTTAYEPPAKKVNQAVHDHLISFFPGGILDFHRK